MIGAAHHCLFETPFGACGIGWSERGIVAVQLPEKDRAGTERRLATKCASVGEDDPPPHVVAVIAAIRQYLAGEKVEFSSVTVDLDGVDAFRRKLYEALRGIGYGCTTTYGELARTLGLTTWEGPRDVGKAMGRNPIPIVIPCHRVLAAGDRLGGFSAYGGSATKRKLLVLEAVGLGELTPRLPGL